jgi:hypothetical protein
MGVFRTRRIAARLAQRRPMWPILRMRKYSHAAFISFALCIAATAVQPQRPPVFTVDQIKSYPFPNQLTAATSGSRIAWTFNESGRRNVWVAEGPDWRARRITSYETDDGQELTSISIGGDGKLVVYVRGGDHGSNWEGPSPNPTSNPVAPKVEIWSLPFSGCAAGRCEPKLLGDGDDPELSPRGDRVAFLKERQIWIVPADGSSPAKKLFSANGSLNSPQWSPDGTRLAFVSNRGDHAFIGVFTSDSTPIVWVAPTTSRDASPRWSPDGRRIAFVRQPGSGGAPDSILVRSRRRWALLTADAKTGESRQIWDAAD